MIGQNMAAVVNIVSRHGLSVGACHRNQPNKSKVALYKALIYMYNWGEPERVPHLSVVDVYVGASRVRGV